MKKLSILIFATLIIMLCFVLTACNNHEHVFGEWEVIQSPTCTSDGLKKRTCECEYEELENIAALGHTEGNVATCTQSQACLSCGEIIASASGHTAGDEPTCTTAQTCTVCNVELVPALGHSEGEWIVDIDPTCTAEGFKHQLCSVCEDTINTESIAALGHSEYVIDAVRATCLKDGLTEGRYCGVCNVITLEQESVPATGHDWVIDRYVEPTCSEYGKTEGSHCSYCNEVKIAQENIAKLEHTVVIDPAISPSCTESGRTQGSHCSVCSTTIVNSIELAPSGHSFNLKTNKCDTCNQQQYVEITNTTEYDAYNKETHIVFNIDKYITPDVQSQEFYYHISKDTEYIRFVGNVDRSFMFYIVVDKRTTPIHIDFVDVNLHSQKSIVTCEYNVDIEVGFYGDSCIIWCDTAPNGVSESLLEIQAKNGKNGANTFDVQGSLTITLAATNYNWIFGGNTAPAGAQLKNCTVKEALDMLVASIDKYFEE